MRTKQAKPAFTVMELIIVVTVIAVLAIITIVVWNSIQRQSVQALVQRTVADAQKTLQTYNVFNRYYPSNIANTEYAPPLTVAVALYTDSPQKPVYQNLTSDQNAQLFLNSCNGYMPIKDGGTTYNTACAYAGNNLHVAGQVSSNIVFQGPTINQSDFTLTCGAACSTAQTSIINTFLDQGGTFPVTVPKNGSTLPAPSLVSTGNASRYCVEARSPTFTDIIYHGVPGSSAPEEGACPADAALHYP